MLVVADAAASRDWYVDALDASVYSEYGGTSVVLDLMGNWLLLVTGGEPSPDKPTVTLNCPTTPIGSALRSSSGSMTAAAPTDCSANGALSS
jgi:hypothetical protein